MSSSTTKFLPGRDAGKAPGARAPARLVEVHDDGGAGQRLDNFLLRELRGMPKSHVYRLIRSGQVRVNGGRRRPDDRLEPGDVVRLPPVDAAVAPAEGRAGSLPVPAQEFPVLYEDESILAVDKPAGVAVHGGSGVAHGVVERLRAARPAARFLELAHRLDRETSGVLLLCKKRRALVALHEQLRERRTDKRYRAIVAGRWPLRTKTVQMPLHRYLTAEGERRVRVQAGGREALTRVTGLAQFELGALGSFTLVEAKIETGRTHQIRVHLAQSGFPIAGDEKYGDFALNKELDKIGLKRMFLHAFMIRFRHPIEDRDVTLEAPLPGDFERLLALGRPATPVVAGAGAR